jgi:hypothetical protein
METFSLWSSASGRWSCKPETPAKKVFKSVDGGKKSKGDAEVDNNTNKLRIDES